VIGPNIEVVREIEKVIIANVEDEDFAYALDKDEEYNLKVVARRMSSPLPKPSAAPRPWADLTVFCGSRSHSPNRAEGGGAAAASFAASLREIKRARRFV
jgi:hypothetical protein